MEWLEIGLKVSQTIRWLYYFIIEKDLVMVYPLLRDLAPNDFSWDDITKVGTVGATETWGGGK